MIDYEAAARHWTDREKDAKRMPADQLRRHIDEFVESHRVGALATATSDGSLVRNTPIEYDWFDGAFWMFSEGGLKFRTLQQNSNVCLAVFDPDPSFGSLAGLQVTGVANVVEPFSPAYEKACGHRGIDPQRLHALPFTMMLVHVVPTRFDMLCSQFKQEGYDVRQWLEM